MSETTFESSRLSESTYPGRGIVIGGTPDGAGILQVYWIMGRSPSSRNRVFVRDGDTVRTDTVDKEMEVDPLTLYAPIRVTGRKHVVTNGDQTDTIVDFAERGESFAAALSTRTFEPDAPNYTPRISGLVDLDDRIHAYELSVIRPLPGAGGEAAACQRSHFSYGFAMRGVGHCVTTYVDDGSPLPPFTGEPFPVELKDDPEEAARVFWDLLNEENRVALVAKRIEGATGESTLVIANRFG